MALQPFGGAVGSPEGYLLGLWVHECRRVFADKLVAYEDKGWVDKAISDLCRTEFPPELCKQVRACVCAHGVGRWRLRCLRPPDCSPQCACERARTCWRLLPAHVALHRAGLARKTTQVDEPLYFVDFLRDPVVDDDTGEVINAHPSHYEAVPGGLVEIRARVEALQRRFNEESKVCAQA